MKSIFSHNFLGAAVVALALGTATASAAEMIEMGGQVQVNVEYEVPAINGLYFYFDAPDSGEAQYWLSTLLTPYYDADFTEEVPNKFYSYDHQGIKTITVEAGERIYFTDTWGWIASQAAGQMFKISMNEELAVTDVNPTAGSQLSMAGYPMVDIWFNQAAKAEKATISANGKTVPMSVPSVPNSYISIDYTTVFADWYADGTLKGGETVTFAYEGLQTADGTLYNGDGNYSVDFVAAPEPLTLVKVDMGDTFKSFYLPGDAEGILTFHFNGEMGSGIMELGYGNKESETGDYYIETIKGIVDGDTVSFDLTGVQRRPQDMLASGTFYSIVEVNVSFTDAAGQPVYSGGQGTIGSFSYHLIYDYIEPVVYAPSFTPEPGSQLTEDTIEIELSNYDKLTYSGVDFTVKDKTYNVPVADIIAKTQGNVTILTVPVPEEVRNITERIVVTFSDMSSADGADHSADFRVVYNGFTLTSFELYNPEGNVITERSLTEFAADDVIQITTNIASEELYIEYQITDVTDKENIKSIAPMVRTTDQFGEPVYQAVMPISFKLVMGHEYHVEFFAYTDEMSRNYGASPIGEEYVAFYGLTPPFYFSSVQFVGAVPANGSEIEPTQTEFVLEFDGLVKIVEDRSFINYGMGMTVAYKSVEPIESEDNEGDYANRWLIVIPDNYISTYQVTELELIVAAVDIDGKVVEGTRGFEELSVIELIYQVASAPFDDFTVTPADQSVLEELSVIEIYSDSYPVSLNWNMSGTDIEVYTRTNEPAGVIPFDNIEIVDIPKPGVQIPDDASIFDDRYYTTKAVMTLAEPITAPGTYMVRIPAGIFTFGTQFTTYNISTTMLVYEIAGEVEPSDVDITPAAGTVKELSGFTLNGWLQPSWNVNVATLSLPNGDVVDILADNFVEVLADPDDFWSDIIGQSYDFGTTYTELGNYVLNIPEGMFNIGEMGDSQNPAWMVIWTLGESGISSVFGDVDSFNVYTINGITVLKNGNAAELDQLPAGMYIINGQKVILKK